MFCLKMLKTTFLVWVLIEVAHPDRTTGQDGPNPCIAYEYRPARIYLNVTNRCTNACVFCSPRHNKGWLGSFDLNLAGEEPVPFQVHPDSVQQQTATCSGHCSEQTAAHSSRAALRLRTMLDFEPDTEKILADFDYLASSIEYPVKEVVFCGAGEPMIRLDTIIEVSKIMKNRGMRVRINTNGHALMMHGPRAVDLLEGLVDEVSVSLNAQDEKTYTKISQPVAGPAAYSALLEFTSRCVRIVGAVTLSAVTLTQNECRLSGARVDPAACESMARNLGAGFRQR